MGSFIEVSNVSKTFRISKRSAGIPGMLANLVAPRYERKEAVRDVSFQIGKGWQVHDDQNAVWDLMPGPGKCQCSWLYSLSPEEEICGADWCGLWTEIPASVGSPGA